MSEITEAPTVKNRAPVPIGNRGVVIESIEALFRIADGVQSSGLAPTSLKSKEAIAIAMQMGMELGIPPMASLQNIAVVNGRPTLWGDAQLGVCRATGELESFGEWYENKTGQLARNPSEFTDDVCAVCLVKRRGYEAQEVSFSVADAKRAGLWGKAGPWTQYPARMLRYRARGFALRDNFGDALRGLMSAEEAGDIIDVTPVESKPKRTVAAPVIVDPAPAPTAAPVQEPQVAQDAPRTGTSTVGTGFETPLPDRQTLSAIIDATGATFDEFVFVMNSNGVWKTMIDGAASLDDMKPEHITRILTKREFLKKQLALVVADRKGVQS